MVELGSITVYFFFSSRRRHTMFPFTYSLPSAAPFHSKGEPGRQSVSVTQLNIYCGMNSLSVRTFQTVLGGASISICLRTTSSLIGFSPHVQCRQDLRPMIGKTRQQPAEVEEYFDPEVGKARGILTRHPPQAGKFRHSRRSPAASLSSWIDHYWMVVWDLRGLEPYRAQMLPHPNFQVVFEEGGSQVGGVSTRMFTRVLQGESHVFGVK